jgi:hypothetical protein
MRLLAGLRPIDFINGEDVIVDGGLVRGRLFTPQQTSLRQVKSMLGLDD